MRALFFVVFVSMLTGCLWDDTPTRVPPSECAATTNPQACNKAFRR